MNLTIKNAYKCKDGRWRAYCVDENGKPVAPPENWYNYNEKKWANILVVNKETNLMSYFVWMPRYEYRVMDASSNAEEKWIDIAFVPVTKAEPTDGYILHTSFDINMGTAENPEIKRLSGFWAGKYEVSDVN